MKYYVFDVTTGDSDGLHIVVDSQEEAEAIDLNCKLIYTFKGKSTTEPIKMVDRTKLTVGDVLCHCNRNMHIKVNKILENENDIIFSILFFLLFVIFVTAMVFLVS